MSQEPVSYRDYADDDRDWTTWEEEEHQIAKVRKLILVREKAWGNEQCK